MMEQEQEFMAEQCRDEEQAGSQSDGELEGSLEDCTQAREGDELLRQMADQFEDEKPKAETSVEPRALRAERIQPKETKELPAERTQPEEAEEPRAEGEQEGATRGSGKTATNGAQEPVECEAAAKGKQIFQTTEGTGGLQAVPAAIKLEREMSNDGKDVMLGTEGAVEVGERSEGASSLGACSIESFETPEQLQNRVAEDAQTGGKPETPITKGCEGPEESSSGPPHSMQDALIEDQHTSEPQGFEVLMSEAEPDEGLSQCEPCTQVREGQELLRNCEFSFMPVSQCQSSESATREGHDGAPPTSVDCTLEGAGRMKADHSGTEREESEFVSQLDEDDAVLKDAEAVLDQHSLAERPEGTEELRNSNVSRSSLPGLAAVGADKDSDIAELDNELTSEKQGRQQLEGSLNKVSSLRESYQAQQSSQASQDMDLVGESQAHVDTDDSPEAMRLKLQQIEEELLYTRQEMKQREEDNGIDHQLMSTSTVELERQLCASRKEREHFAAENEAFKQKLLTSEAALQLASEEKSKLSTYIVTLEQRLKQAEEGMSEESNKAQHILGLEAKIQDLCNSLQKQSREHEEKNQKIVLFEQSEQSSKSELKSLKEQLETFESEVRLRDEKLQSLQTRFEALEEKAKEAEKNKEAKEHLETKLASAAQIQTDLLKSKADEIKHLKQIQESLEQQLQTAKHEHEKELSEKVEIAEAKTQLELGLHFYKQSLQSACDEKSKLNKDIETLQQHLKAEQERVNLSHSKDELEEELVVLEETAQQVRNENLKLSSKVQGLQAQLMEESKARSEGDASKDDEIARLGSANYELESSLKKEKTCNQKGARKVAELQENLSVQEKKMDELEQRFKAEMDRMNKEVCVANSTIRSNQQSHEAQAEQLHRDLLEREHAIKDAEQRLSDFAKSADLKLVNTQKEHQRIKTQLRKEIDEREKQMEGLSRKLKEYQQAIEASRESSEKLQSDLQICNENLEFEKQTSASFKNKSNDALQRLSTAQEELKELVAVKNELVNDLQVAKAKLEDLESKHKEATASKEFLSEELKALEMQLAKPTDELESRRSKGANTAAESSLPLQTHLTPSSFWSKATNDSFEQSQTRVEASHVLLELVSCAKGVESAEDVDTLIIESSEDECEEAKLKTNHGAAVAGSVIGLSASSIQQPKKGARQSKRGSMGQTASLPASSKSETSAAASRAEAEEAAPNASSQRCRAKVPLSRGSEEADDREIASVVTRKTRQAGRRRVKFVEPDEVASSIAVSEVETISNRKRQRSVEAHKDSNPHDPSPSTKVRCDAEEGAAKASQGPSAKRTKKTQEKAHQVVKEIGPEIKEVETAVQGAGDSVHGTEGRQRRIKAELPAGAAAPHTPVRAGLNELDETMRASVSDTVRKDNRKRSRNSKEGTGEQTDNASDGAYAVQNLGMPISVGSVGSPDGGRATATAGSSSADISPMPSLSPNTRVVKSKTPRQLPGEKVILFSGLNPNCQDAAQRSELDSLKKCVERLGAKYSDDALACTHCVAKNIRFSASFLSGMAVGGLRFVTAEWLKASDRHRTFQDEDQFQLQDEEKEAQVKDQYDVDLRTRLKEQHAMPFKGKRLSLDSKIVKTRKEDILRIIRSAGGEIVKTNRQSDYHISETKCTKGPGQISGPVYDMEFLKASVLCNRIMLDVGRIQ